MYKSVFAQALPGWQVKLTGWPWWVVVLLAVAGVWALLRMHRVEMAMLPSRTRRRLLLLRSAALALLVLFLIEPSLTRRITEKVMPLVAVLIDQSGSMAVKDESMPPGEKLAEAIGLGLVQASVRPMQTNATQQAASDQSIVASAKEGSAVAKALAAFVFVSLSTCGEDGGTQHLARSPG